MVLERDVLVPRDKVGAETRALLRSHWPGPTEEYPVGENESIRCRRVSNVGEQNGVVWLRCIYEG